MRNFVDLVLTIREMGVSASAPKCEREVTSEGLLTARASPSSVVSPPPRPFVPKTDQKYEYVTTRRLTSCECTRPSPLGSATKLRGGIPTLLTDTRCTACARLPALRGGRLFATPSRRAPPQLPSAHRSAALRRRRVPRARPSSCSSRPRDATSPRPRVRRAMPLPCCSSHPLAPSRHAASSRPPCNNGAAAARDSGAVAAPRRAAATRL